MASRNRTILSEDSKEPLSQSTTGEGYRFLPWVDCICAGVPCQDVSVAGKRAGLGGKRTGLFYEFARILQELRPTWFIFENVPGLLSSNHGRDFAEVLRVLMVECGYGVCWRVLNSQFFGVAQRRRRLFIVGYLGRPCPPAVLFEPESRSRGSQKSRQAGQDIANSITSGTGNVGSRGADDGANIVARTLANSGCGYRNEPNSEEFVVCRSLRESDGHHGRSSPRGNGYGNLVAATLSAGSFAQSHSPGRRREDDFNLVATLQGSGHSGQSEPGQHIVATLNTGGTEGGFRSEPGEHIVIQDARGQRDKRQNGIGIQCGGPSYTLDGTSQHAVAFDTTQITSRENRSNPQPGDPCHTLQSGAHAPAVASTISVRRLTPRECERLQGFPDDYTIPKGSIEKGLDSARYRALGNAVTVQVAEWIGKRIMQHETEGKTYEKARLSNQIKR